MRDARHCDVASAPAKQKSGVALVELQFSTEDDSELFASGHALVLLIRRRSGWCAADLPLEPTWPVRSHCATENELRWGSGTSFDLRTQRTCYESLDQGELEAGESDVQLRECANLSYRLAHGESGPRLTSRTILSAPACTD